MTDDDQRSSNRRAVSSNPLRVMGNRNFARLFYAGATSISGSSLGLVALNWLVYSQTGSPTNVAYLALTSIVATLALSLVAGTLVDRQNRRLMMIICDLVRSASLVILAFALVAFGFNLLLILAVSFILGAFSTVFYPAERALMPTLIRKDEVEDANGLVMTTNALFQAVANGAGGALVALVGAVAALGLNSATFAVSAVFIASIVTGRSLWKGPEIESGRKSSFLSDAVDGVRYLVRWRGLLYITVSAALMNLFFAMMTTFIVVYTARVLSGGAFVYGALLSLFGLGFAPGALLVGRTNAVRAAGLVWVTAGAFAFVLALAPSEYVAFTAAFGLGFVSGYSNTTWLSVVQLIVPTEMQGRYFGVDQLGSFAVVPVGQVVGAFLITVNGVRFDYLVAAFGILVSSAIFLLSGEMRGLGYNGPGRTE
jgi:MFS family permease